MPHRLERSATNKMIAGVCGGIAEYLQVDATFVRVLFAVLVFFGGIGLFAYVLLVIIMPLPGGRAAGDVTDAPSDATAAAPAATAPTTPLPVDTERRRQVAGYVLIALGVIFLLSNQGLFRFAEGGHLWPLALVALGVLLLAQRTRR